MKMLERYWARLVVLLRRRVTLARELEALKAQNEQLRAKLGEAQQAKVLAVNQANDLRDEKERLRDKVRDLKKELKQQSVINSQLDARLLELQETLEGWKPESLKD